LDAGLKLSIQEEPFSPNADVVFPEQMRNWYLGGVHWEQRRLTVYKRNVQRFYTCHRAQKKVSLLDLDQSVKMKLAAFPY
jgi:hypothetical protein